MTGSLLPRLGTTTLRGRMIKIKQYYHSSNLPLPNLSIKTFILLLDIMKYKNTKTDCQLFPYFLGRNRCVMCRHTLCCLMLAWMLHYHSSGKLPIPSHLGSLTLSQSKIKLRIIWGTLKKTTHIKFP